MVGRLSGRADVRRAHLPAALGAHRDRRSRRRGDPWTGETIFAVIGFVTIGLGFLGAPQIFVRFLALRDEGEIGKGAAVALTWTILADTGAVLVGMVGRAMFSDDLGQDVLPTMVDLLPALLVGIYIAVVISAIMSTVDSLLVLGGSAIARDYWQKVRHPDAPDEQLVPLSRTITFSLAFAAFAVAMIISLVQDEPASIFWFVLVGFYGLSATFGPTVVLSLFWKRFTAKGALAAMITGFTSMLFFEFVGPHLGDAGPYLAKLTSLPPAFLLSLLAGVVVSRMSPPSARFLERVSADLDEAKRR
ncbi:MAG: hypothetical protein CVU56_28010 [Deltaproteobacteria bacterium HGW-Deltaproteobacteria-14]|nr:MAG: hypothetical protein CVU56_28010 [Deltaproteobacteria bacterium HGW-Deltaproteobacteria-14]